MINVNDYIVTIDLRGCKISEDAIKRIIKRNADILITNEVTKVVDCKMYWEFSSTDNDIENKVQKVIYDMYLERSIYGGNIKSKLS